jgi:hypothetical protein
MALQLVPPVTHQQRIDPASPWLPPTRSVTIDLEALPAPDGAQAAS